MRPPLIRDQADALVWAALARERRRWRLARALRNGTLAAAVALLLLGACRLLFAPPEAAAGGALALVMAALLAGAYPAPTPLELASACDLRLRASGPQGHDPVLCAVALMGDQRPRGERDAAFVRMATQQAARALSTLPPRPLELSGKVWSAAAAMALLGTLSLGLVPHTRAQAPTPRAPHAARAPRDPAAGSDRLSPPGAVGQPASRGARAQDLRRAHEALAKARRAAAATDALANSLSGAEATRRLGEALAARDPFAVAEALAALRVVAQTPQDSGRSALAAALGEAAPALQGALEEDPGNGSAAGASGAGSDAPELQRLQRDLESASLTCADDPAGCADRVSDLEPPLTALADEQAQREAEDLRERLTRERNPESPRAEGGPTRDPEDLSPDPTQRAQATPSPRAQGEGDNRGATIDLPPSAGAAAAGSPPPIVPETADSRGSTVDVFVPLPGAPPDRTELVSATAAEGGFAHSHYRATYQAYRRAVEDRLYRTPLPEGRRQTVRRYFHRIRPTTPPRKPEP